MDDIFKFPGLHGKEEKEKNAENMPQGLAEGECQNIVIHQAPPQVLRRYKIIFLMKTDMLPIMAVTVFLRCSS